MSTLRSAISLLYTAFEEVLAYKDLIVQIQNIIAYFIDTSIQIALLMYCKISSYSGEMVVWIKPTRDIN